MWKGYHVWQTFAICHKYDVVQYPALHAKAVFSETPAFHSLEPLEPDLWVQAQPHIIAWMLLKIFGTLGLAFLSSGSLRGFCG